MKEVIIYKYFKNLLKIITLLFLFNYSYYGLAEEIGGNGWYATYEDGDKKIILFEKDGSFTYLNVSQLSGNEGNVYGDDNETWKEVNNKLILSFNDGYRICSLIREKWSREIMNGSCINKQGHSGNMQLRLIK